MDVHQPQAMRRRKLLAATRHAAPAFASNGRVLPRGVFLTDRERTPSPEAVASRLPRGWAVIFRHFGAADRVEAGLRLAAACRARGVMLLIAADPDLARRLKADGVHWPENRLRRVRPIHPQWIETASAHSRAGLAAASRAGVDAAILSAVFASRSASAGRPIGHLAFRRLAAGATLPVYALGGVSAANAGRVTGDAARGVAGIAAIDSIGEAWASRSEPGKFEG